MFLNAKKPVIRKVIVQKKAAPSPTPPPPPSSSSTSSNVKYAPTSSRQGQVAKAQDVSRSRSRPSPQSQPTQKKHLHVQREESRKRKTTPSQILSSDSESSDDDHDENGQISNKRTRVIAHEQRLYDMKRQIWRLDRDVATEDDRAPSGLLTGANLVEGNPGDFQPAFTGDSGISQLNLRYPGDVRPER